MKKMKNRNLIIPILILAVLLTVFFFILEVTGFVIIDRRVIEQNESKLSSIRQSIIDIDEEINTYRDAWIEKNSRIVKIMALSLEDLVIENGYEGPEIFDAGFILRVDGDEIIYPEDFLFYIEDLQLPKDINTLGIFEGFLHSEDMNEPVRIIYSVTSIADNTYYVDLTEYSKYQNYIRETTDMFNRSLLDIEASYGGHFVIFSNETNDLLYCSDTLLDLANLDLAENLSDLGIDKEDIDKKTDILIIGPNAFISSYLQMRFLDTSVTTIVLIDSINHISVITHNILFVIVLTAVILTGLIFWQFWVRKYIGEHKLTQDQYNHYLPQKVRQTTASVIMIGMAVIFIATLLFQYLGNLRSVAMSGQESLETVITRITKIQNEKTWHQQDAEEWSAYYSERIAELLSDRPELRTQKALSSFNDIIGSEYIMLFDSSGAEIISSNAYAGFQLETDISDNSTDFSRLLMGIDTIVQPPDMDPVTGRFLQMTGSPVSFENSKKYGAVIIAFSPLESWVMLSHNEIEKFTDRITQEGNLCIIVDVDSGKISYSSDPKLVNESIFSCGLELQERKNSELDSFTIRDNRYYGSFKEQDGIAYYFLTDSDYLKSNSTFFAFLSAIGFLIIGLILSLVMLFPYRTKLYKEAVTVQEEIRNDSILDLEDNDTVDLDFESKGFYVWWSKLLPEKKNRILILVLTGIILIGIAVQLVNSDAFVARTSIGFVLRGNWTHGFNMLALTAILFMVMAFIIYYFFKELLVGMLTNVLDPKGQTVLRLTSSIIQYGVVVGLVFKSLDYLGINTTVMLAGFSAFSLAVSLGGKDLVADILAGIFIVFEDDFHAGDFIEVNGFKGIVQEIGVRSTKILGLGDNIKIIGNQSVKNVLNMSKMNSWYTMELPIPSDQPIAEIEEMIVRELPAIGESIPEIISGPFYKGIWTISKGTYTLAINAECKEINIRHVQRKLNHELIMLFTKKGYRIN